MLKIKITEENKDKINEVIAGIEGKATARTCTFKDVQNLAEKIEAHLESFNCPKKDRPNTEAYYCEKIGVKAYSKKAYAAQSTLIHVIRGSSDWFFVGAERVEINPSDASSEYSFIPSPQAVDSVLRIAEKNFRSV